MMSASFPAALIANGDERELLIPLADAFRRMSAIDKTTILGLLQARCDRGGMEAKVVLFWRDADGRAAFLGPEQLHPVLKRLGFEDVQDVAVGVITWDDDGPPDQGLADSGDYGGSG